MDGEPGNGSKIERGAPATLWRRAGSFPPSRSPRLRLIPRPRSGESALLPSGAKILCDLREVEHPEGRFRRSDGTRYDVCLMEVLTHPHLRPPAISRSNFVGDCADNQPAVIRLGNVRQSSFRVSLISPGEALGTAAAQSKSTILADD